MDPLTVFFASIALAAFPSGTSRDDRRWAIQFVRDRAKKWGPVYASRMAEDWPDPDSVLDQIWEQESMDASRDSVLSDDWLEAHELLGRRDEELFRKLVSAYTSGGVGKIEEATRYGQIQPPLRSPLGDELPVVTSPFGKRTHPVTGKVGSFHEGIDLRAAQGTPVLAPAAGTVAYLTSNGTCGWGLAIDHSPTLRTVYCHLSRRDCKKGQQLEAGEQIGLSGGAQGHPGAGRSTAAHLHFGVQTRTSPAASWKAVDPVPFIGGPAPVVEGWFEWLSSLWPFSSEEVVPDGPMATVTAGPGASFVLVAPDGAEWGEGDVPAGGYELVVDGQSPVSVLLEANRSYRVSSIGGLFPG